MDRLSIDIDIDISHHTFTSSSTNQSIHPHPTTPTQKHKRHRRLHPALPRRDGRREGHARALVDAGLRRQHPGPGRGLQVRCCWFICRLSLCLCCVVGWLIRLRRGVYVWIYGYGEEGGKRSNDLPPNSNQPTHSPTISTTPHQPTNHPPHSHTIIHPKTKANEPQGGVGPGHLRAGELRLHPLPGPHLPRGRPPG